MAPIVGRFGLFRDGRDGAIAQLGERVVRNDEVGGSIPPGSTTLRPSGYAWRSRAEPGGRSVVPGEAQRAKTGWLKKLTSSYLLQLDAWRSRAEPEGRSVVPGEAQRAKTGWLNKLISYPKRRASGEA
jgi:hypothetical protein